MERPAQRRRQLPPLSILEQQPLEIVVEILIRAELYAPHLLDLLNKVPRFSKLLRDPKLWEETYKRYFDPYYQLHEQQRPFWAKSWFIAFWFTWTFEMVFAKGLVKDMLQDDQAYNVKYMLKQLNIRQINPWGRHIYYILDTPYTLKSGQRSITLFKFKDGEAEFYIEKYVNQHMLRGTDVMRNIKVIQTPDVLPFGHNMTSVEVDFVSPDKLLNEASNYGSTLPYIFIPLLEIENIPNEELSRIQETNPLAGQSDHYYIPQPFLRNTTFGMFHIFVIHSIPQELDFQFRPNAERIDLILDVIRLSQRSMNVVALNENIFLEKREHLKTSDYDTDNLLLLVLYYKLKVILPRHLYFYWGFVEYGASNQEVYDRLEAGIPTNEDMEKILQIGKGTLTFQKILDWAIISNFTDASIKKELEPILNNFAISGFNQALSRLESYIRSRIISAPRTEDKGRWAINKKICGWCYGYDENQMFICGNCKIQSYCSKSCQEKHWKDHKKIYCL